MTPRHHRCRPPSPRGHRAAAASVLAGILAIGGGCTEYSYSQQTQTDVFQQVSRNVVDIVVVVDNSGSMVEEQDKLASNFDAFISAFEGVDVDWQIGVITTDTWQDDHQGRLRGGDDEIVLSCGDGVKIDGVAWDADWGIEEGAALQLDPSVSSASGNDAASAWCAATETYGDSDRGTPGQANTDCAKAPTSDTGAPDTGTDTGSGDTGDGGEDTGDPGGDTGDPGALPQPDSSGDVLITEFMADPADVDDSVGEWLELFNPGETDLDLSGCELNDDGRNAFTLPDGVEIPAGGRLVLARSGEGGVDADVELGDAFTLNNDVLLLTPDTPEPAEIFAEMVAVGITGSGLEMGFEALRQAFSEPTYTDHNGAFLRDDANLSVILLSDEDDVSPYPVDDYLRFLTELKGEEAYRDHALFRFSAVVGVEEPEIDGEPSCSSEHGDAAYGSRYIKAAERTEGLMESICAEDFSPIATDLGLTASGLEVEFALSESCDENSLEVSLYETPEDEGFVRVLEKDTDYTYVVEDNAIRFEEEQIPPSEWYVVATYRILASGASSGGEQEQEEGQEEAGEEEER